MADLITLQEYKNYKGIGANPNKDATHNIVISSVSDLIKSYCGRTFIDYYTDPKTDIIKVGDGVTAIILEEHPIVLLSSIVYDGVDISADIFVDSSLGIIRYPETFKTGRILEITYRGGYSSTPNDLKLAALELVDYYMDGEHKSRKSLSGASIEYHASGQEWPFHIRTILDTYRDV